MLVQPTQVYQPLKLRFVQTLYNNLLLWVLINIQTRPLPVVGEELRTTRRPEVVLLLCYPRQYGVVRQKHRRQLYPR